MAIMAQPHRPTPIPKPFNPPTITMRHGRRPLRNSHTPLQQLKTASEAVLPDGADMSVADVRVRADAGRAGH